MSYSVMLVSADKELGRVLKITLRETTARITVEAESPQAAADAMASNPVSLVVLDLFLPNSSGLEALKILRRVNENCLCLLLTRMRTRSLIERAFRLGAQDVLHYPVSTIVLRDTILHRLEAQPLPEAEDAGEHATKVRKK